MGLNLPLALGDTLSVQFGTYWNGQAGINTLHVQVVQAVGLPTLADVAKGYDDLVHAAYKDLLTSTATYYGVRAQRITPLPRSMAEISTLHTGVGLGGTEGMPGQVSGIIGWATAKAGRAFRGRIYIPFPDENDHNNNTNAPSDSYILRLKTLGDILAAEQTVTNGVNTATLLPCIWHRKGIANTTILEARPRLKWATQRSRGAYGAVNRYPPF